MTAKPLVFPLYLALVGLLAYVATDYNRDLARAAQIARLNDQNDRARAELGRWPDQYDSVAAVSERVDGASSEPSEVN